MKLAMSQKTLLFCPSVIILLLFSACTTSRTPPQPHVSLEHVNCELQGKWAIIELFDGHVIQTAEDVIIGVETTRYFDRAEQRHKIIPTFQIALVARKLRTGWKKGAWPGLAVIGISLVEARRQRYGGTPGDYILPGLILGIPVTALGMVVGGVVAKGAPLIVYQGPVSRYASSEQYER